MRKIILATFAAALLMTVFSGCGRIDDEAEESSFNDNSEKNDSISVTVPPDNAPDDLTISVSDSDTVSTDEESSAASIKINTYRAEDVPELIGVINDTLEAAAGDFEDFENVFDEDLIIEVLVRSSYTDETEIEKTLESFTDDMRAQTVRQDYEFLHGPLSENPCDGEIENLTLQCYDKTLDEAILFDLNFDMKCRDGMVTFVGNAYKLDGKWGAMFEPTEYREETDQLSSLLTEGE